MFDPAAACCPHGKNKHRRVGFRPCTIAGCECKTFWRRLELKDASA